MSKRPYKDETFIRQTKKRITEKEVIHNSTDELECLYERTVQKLFDGARSCIKHVDGNQNVKKAIEKTCSSCHSMAVSTCENCTSYLCCDCRKLCGRCMEIFCHDCLFSEKAVCINCS